MRSIFEFNSYKDYLKYALSQFPKQGRGQVNKLAEHMLVHPTLVSQVLNNKRDLSIEQIHRAGDFLGLSEIELEFFIHLGLLEKAGSKDLENFFQKRINTLVKQSTKVSKQFEKFKEITEEDQAIFYSSWYHVAIWLYCSVGSGQTIESISKKFNISTESTKDHINYLVRLGLCCANGNRFEPGERHIHLDKGSKMLPHYHAMWRLQGIHKSHRISEDELMFTSPLTIAKKDFPKIKAEVLKLLKKCESIVKNSAAEELACLNVDLFWVEASKD